MPFFPLDRGPQPGSHCAKHQAEEDAPSVRDGPPGARAGRPPAPGSEPEKGENTCPCLQQAIDDDPMMVNKTYGT